MQVSLLRNVTLYIQPIIQLNISYQLLECISKFKYLGIWLTNNLSLSTHIERVTKHATQQAGIIFRKFYAHSHPDTLKQLYLSFVRPHLEYAAQVWDPYHTTHINALEKVQKFALRMCFKAWGESYDTALHRSDLPSLCRRKKLHIFSKSLMSPSHFQTPL